jgi:hypothetical protein
MVLGRNPNPVSWMCDGGIFHVIIPFLKTSHLETTYTSWMFTIAHKPKSTFDGQTPLVFAQVTNRRISLSVSLHD